MIDTTKFVRKPLYVDAVQVTSDNFLEVAKWCQGDIQITEDQGVPNGQYIRVRVHNPKSPRQTRAFVGDWILYAERGYKVYTDKAFRSNFEAVLEPVISNTSTGADINY